MSRRALCQAAAATGALTVAGPAFGFGEEGAFHPRILLTGTATWEGKRRSAPSRWSRETVSRTSAPAKLTPATVRADAVELVAEPFVVWTGSQAPEALTRSEIQGLRRFLALGGLILCDEQEPSRGDFLAGAKREIARVLPDASPIAIDQKNVVFRSFYLLASATGRVQKSAELDAIVRGGAVQVIFSPNDLLGALATEPGGVHPFEVTPNGELQREHAVRLAVNVAMYVLCSNYKDDQVHAPFLMRRRATGAK